MRRLGAIALILYAASASADERPAGPPVLQKSENLSVPVDAELLQKQFAALSAMPDVQVQYTSTGSVMTVSGNTGIVLPASVHRLQIGDSAPVVLEAFRTLLLANGTETLTVRRNFLWRAQRDIRFDQSIRGIPVVDGLFALGLNVETGRVNSLGGWFLPDRNLPTKPALSASEALKALVTALESYGDATPGTVEEIEKPRLAYYGLMPNAPRPQLVWEVHVNFTCPTGRQDSERVWINAIDGSVAGRRSTVSYMMSPGPCQAREEVQADCKSEPHPLLGDAPYSSSCQPSSAKPRLIVTRMGCTNNFQLIWPRIPGASQYHVISAPVDLGWAFTRTVAAGQIHQCTTTVDTPTMVRMRPCDGCGCGEWSETLMMDPQAVCETPAQ